jgi:hypothetical protein
LERESPETSTGDVMNFLLNVGGSPMCWFLLSCVRTMYVFFMVLEKLVNPSPSPTTDAASVVKDENYKFKQPVHKDPPVESPTLDDTSGIRMKGDPNPNLKPTGEGFLGLSFNSTSSLLSPHFSFTLILIHRK